jgi:hypothetical protein
MTLAAPTASQIVVNPTKTLDINMTAPSRTHLIELEDPLSQSGPVFYPGLPPRREEKDVEHDKTGQ